LVAVPDKGRLPLELLLVAAVVVEDYLHHFRQNSVVEM